MTVIKYLGKSRIEYLLYDNVCALNLNAVITKFNFNVGPLHDIMREILLESNVINLCGFANLCYKLKIGYGSDISFTLAKGLKSFFDAYYPDVRFCQSLIDFDGAQDLLPVEHLWSIDEEFSVLYCHRMLSDALELIGFTTAQLPEILTKDMDLSAVLPKDIISSMPLLNEHTLDRYHELCEVFKC